MWSEAPLDACLSVDVEQDRAPDTTSWRGIAEGLPRLLSLLAALRIRATFFVTGESARRFPAAVGDIVAAGHELGSHGDQHIRFDRATMDEARRDVGQSLAALSKHSAQLASFRAPYLRMPSRLLPVLTEAGLRIDSSEGRHKSPWARVRRQGSVGRVPTSVVPSVLWWPAVLRDAVLRGFGQPLVLYVHPWEFVDFSAGEVRRSPTVSARSPSSRALPRLRDALASLQSRGVCFRPIDAIAERWLSAIPS
jgi:peptidoglycan/xylan/chitin deacetylase (PgdA/CDA1 family)